MKIYQKPDMCVIVLQHKTTLLTDSITRFSSTAGLNYGGSSNNYSGEGGIVVRTKESTNIWDEEW